MMRDPDPEPTGAANLLGILLAGVGILALIAFAALTLQARAQPLF